MGGSDEGKRLELHANGADPRRTVFHQYIDKTIFECSIKALLRRLAQAVYFIYEEYISRAQAVENGEEGARRIDILRQGAVELRLHFRG